MGPQRAFFPLVQYSHFHAFLLSSHQQPTLNSQYYTPQEKLFNFLGSAVRCSDSGEVIHHCHRGELRSSARSITADELHCSAQLQPHESAATVPSAAAPPARKLHCANGRHVHSQPLFMQRLLCFGRKSLQDVLPLYKDQFHQIQSRYELLETPCRECIMKSFRRCS